MTVYLFVCSDGSILWEASRMDTHHFKSITSTTKVQYLDLDLETTKERHPTDRLYKLVTKRLDQALVRKIVCFTHGNYFYISVRILTKQ